ncbi:MAG: tetratricopeptide repeat protein [Planctomycetota bacterium]
MDEAAGELHEVLRLQPEDARARTFLGGLYLRMQDPDAAILHLNRAREIAPTSPEVHESLGRAYLAKGMAAEAILAFPTALHCQPDHDAARRGLEAAEHLRRGESAPDRGH